MNREKNANENQAEDMVLIEKYRTGQSGIIEKILDKYKFLVRKTARKYFLIGGDDEDLLQEGMIALVRAAETYSLDSEVTFRYYSLVLIERQIINAVKASTRKKHMPLNTYVSFFLSVDESGDLKFEDMLSNREDSPEDILINEEQVQKLVENIFASLSIFETQVLELHLEGDDYLTIAQKLGKNSKAIDNALQRIKKKTESILKDNDLS